MAALRWGIAGAGKISHDFVCAVQTHSEEIHKIVAIAARSIDSATEFANSHNIAQAYEGYEALAKDPSVEIVYIGLLNPKHLEVSKLMMENGKHVLCEKPLTMNYKDSKELVDNAKKNGVFLMEAVWSRCFPAYDKMRALIEEGAIGEVQQVTVDFGFILEHVDRVNVKELGGSAILDIGVYVLQFSQYVFRGQTPIDVVSSGHLNEHGTDDSAAAILMYPEGKTSVLAINARAELSNTAHVYGTKGTLKIPFFWCPTTLITPTDEHKFELPKSSAKFNYLHSNGLAYEAEEARKCIRAGLKESPKMTHGDSLELAELMDTLRENVATASSQDE